MVGLIAVVLIALVAARHGPTQAANAGPAPTESAAPVHPPPPVLARVVVHASPADAVVSFDGARVANPFVGSFESDAIEHRLQVARSGYVTTTKLVRLDRDVSLDIVLDKVAERPPPAPSVAPAKPPPPSGQPPATKVPPLDVDPWR
jgi:hypothetical protein